MKWDLLCANLVVAEDEVGEDLGELCSDFLRNDWIHDGEEQKDAGRPSQAQLLSLRSAPWPPCGKSAFPAPRRRIPSPPDSHVHVRIRIRLALDVEESISLVSVSPLNTQDIYPCSVQTSAGLSRINFNPT